MKNPPLHLVWPALMSLGIAFCIISTRQPADNGENMASNYASKCSGRFILRSSAVTNGGTLPVEFTGDGAGISPPLSWNGAPADTQCFAIIMHHVDPHGVTKWYWTLYNIPANVRSLPENVQGIGTLGNNSVNHKTGYAPPHSKGPGAKIYRITIYALSAPVQISLPPAEVNRNVLLNAMKDRVLDSAGLKFTYDRTRFIGNNKSSSPQPRD
jgi:Raf kinase inhibitor-like YbhB/YbcL family protein